MSRPSTGTVKWRPNPNKPGTSCWQARYTRGADGSRTPWYVLDENIAKDDEAGARAFALEFASLAKATTKDGTGETLSAYSVRWLAQRTPGARKDNGYQLKAHVLPVIGSVPVRAITPAHGDKLVAALDDKIAEGMAESTAYSVWATVKGMLQTATNAKPATGLRCLEINPFANVQPPENSHRRKALQWLYPSEFLTLMRHPDVPRAFKRNVAIAVFLGLRYSEQKALRFEYVDTDAALVTVCETFDALSGKAREGTKTGAVRHVPIHPAILPMIVAMKEKAHGKGLVCPDIYAREASARALRTWLLNAGVERLALYKRTSVSSPIRWHDLRSTFATWHALSPNANAMEIRDLMGHTNTAMTDKYLRNAQSVRGGNFGQPFPTLPDLMRHRRDNVETVAEKAKPYRQFASGYLQPSPVG